MSEWRMLVPVFAVGIGLGAVFFAGLWWTVRRGMASAQPGAWFFASLLVRTAAVMGGFYLVGGADWARWAVCLSGFVVGRVAVQALLRGRAVRDAA